MRSHTISRFGTIIALLISSGAFAAGTGGSEVVLFTPWSFIQKKITTTLNARTISDSQSIAATDWQLSPWTPHLTNVKWNYKSKVDVVSLTPQAVQLKTRQLSVSITIEKINIDQIIDREVDGATLHVHVQAQCGPITMSQSSAQMETRLGFQIQPQHVVTSVDMFTLTWAPNSWQVADFQCQGPGGFDQTVKAELAADLKSPEKVRPFLQAIIAGRAQAEADSLMTQIVNPMPAPVEKGTLVLQFQRLEDSPEGILNYGTLVWSGKNGETNLSRLIMNGLPPAAAKSVLPLFITPADGWTNLIAVQLRLRGDTFSVDMNKIKDFSDLLASPSEQSAVWPDLQNYSTAAKFVLLVASPHDYTLEWRADGTANLHSPMSAVIEAQRAGKMWNYVALSGSVTGRLVPQIHNNQLSASIKFNDSKFGGKFEPEYIKTFQPDTTLDDRILQAFSTYVNQGFNISNTLPILNLGFAGRANFNGWMGISPALIGLTMDLQTPVN